MTTLRYAQRAALPKSSFAIPSKAPGPGSYPIPDMAHANNAKARVAANGTPAQVSKVLAAVHRRFPSTKKPVASKKPNTRYI